MPTVVFLASVVQWGLVKVIFCMIHREYAPSLKVGYTHAMHLEQSLSFQASLMIWSSVP